MTEEANQEAAGFVILTRDDFHGEESPLVRIIPLRTKDGQRVTADHLASMEPRAAFVTAVLYNDAVTVPYRSRIPRLTDSATPTTSASSPRRRRRRPRSLPSRILLTNNRAWIAAETVRARLPWRDLRQPAVACRGSCRVFGPSLKLMAGKRIGCF